MDPLREHPGHQGERAAAAGEAQQWLEKSVWGAGGVPELPEGRTLLENEDGGRQPATPTESAAAAGGGQREDGQDGADGRSRVQHLLHQQWAGPPCKWSHHTFNPLFYFVNYRIRCWRPKTVFMGFWFPLVFQLCILPVLSKTSVRFLRGCCGSRERRDGLTSLSPAVYWALPVTCWDIHLSSTPWMGPVSVVHPETIFLLFLTFKNSFLMLSLFQSPP